MKIEKATGMFNLKHCNKKKDLNSKEMTITQQKCN